MIFAEAPALLLVCLSALLRRESRKISILLRLDPMQRERSVQILVDAFGEGEIVRSLIVRFQRVVALPGLEDDIAVRMQNVRIDVVADVALLLGSFRREA